MPESQDNEVSFDVIYALENENREILATSSAKAKLGELSLMIEPVNGNDLSISYTDIVDISDEDYIVKMLLSSRDEVTLSQIGYEYENFLITLYKLRNELYLKYLLMNEGLRAAQIEASFSYTINTGDEFKGLCEARLFDSALVILPQKNKPVRIPYCYINGVKEEAFSIIVETELGERLTLTQLGEKRDFLRRSLSEAMSKLSLRAQGIIGEIQPQLDTMKKRKLSELMKDGRAAERAEVDKITPEFWSLLEAKVRTMGLTESYDFLRDLSQRDRISLGVKRSLSDKEEEDYVWFLIPIYSDDPHAPGNAVALEATTGVDEGRATYFFRILDRGEYSIGKDLSTLHSCYKEFLATINRCMIEINFRREPIYLTIDQLNDPKYVHYRFAAQEISSLQKLRTLFIGRVMHYNPDQWRSDVNSLLSFNVNEKSEDRKWEKGAD
jgi:hypothetical protein